MSRAAVPVIRVCRIISPLSSRTPSAPLPSPQ
jgi:hypothetical protein